MRSREEIKADFERTAPKRKEEQLAFQRQKLMLEAMMLVDCRIEALLKYYAIEALDELEEKVKKS